MTTALYFHELREIIQTGKKISGLTNTLCNYTWRDAFDELNIDIYTAILFRYRRTI